LDQQRPPVPAQYHSYDPATGHRLAHDPFKAIIAPRPIGWISSIDPAGNVNLAPYSFFNAFASDPPIIGFASEGRKDSVSNIEKTREFVFNLVSFPLVEAMNETSGSYTPDIDEFDVAGLECAASVKVRPPRVAASPATLECKCLDIIQLKALDDRKLNSFLVLGQVVQVHINSSFLRDGIFDTVAAQSVARCGYRGDYAKVESIFEMLRPVVS
jgi:flavin reductase (DIM6/NTAB) family NADH-FMN oxidoreductase RutF